MHNKIRDRLEILKEEFKKGQIEFQELEKRKAYLHETMLRISGAIKVLEELLGDRMVDACIDPGAAQFSTGISDNEATPTVL